MGRADGQLRLVPEERSREELLLAWRAAGRRYGSGGGRGLKARWHTFKKRKEKLYFLLCLVSQFPILD